MNTPASVRCCTVMVLAMASLISIGCANAAKSASRSAIAEQNKIVLSPDDYEWVSVTGSNLRVRVPKNRNGQASNEGTNAVSGLSVDQFRVLQDKTSQMVNQH